MTHIPKVIASHFRGMLHSLLKANVVEIMLRLPGRQHPPPPPPRERGNMVRTSTTLHNPAQSHTHTHSCTHHQNVTLAQEGVLQVLQLGLQVQHDPVDV